MLTSEEVGDTPGISVHMTYRYIPVVRLVDNVVSLIFLFLKDNNLR